MTDGGHMLPQAVQQLVSGTFPVRNALRWGRQGHVGVDVLGSCMSMVLANECLKQGAL